MMEKERFILITGSSGLIGRALCHRLGSAGKQVVGLDREGPPFPPPKTECIFADLTSDESLQDSMFIVEQRFGRQIDAVIHLAAYYSFTGEDSHLYEDLTYKGTKRLFRELERCRVSQFIFASTMLVHAPGDVDCVINEDSPLGATWEYPSSKIRAEKLIKEIHGSIPATILRIAGVYTDLCESVPIAHQIQRINETQMTGYVYPGDIRSAQSFVHLDDLVDAFTKVMDKREQLGDWSVFLIGEAESMSYDDLQDKIGHMIHGKHWMTYEVPKPLAKSGAWVQEHIPFKPEPPFIRPWMIDRADDNYVLDINKARMELGWEPKHSLKNTLPKMIEGLKVDSKRWYRINKLTGLDKPVTKEVQKLWHKLAS